MIIRWLTIPQASILSGLDEDFLTEAIMKNKLKSAKFGTKQGITKITDLELNRFTLDLQYPKETAEKMKAKLIFKNNPVDDFLHSLDTKRTGISPRVPDFSN